MPEPQAKVRKGPSTCGSQDALSHSGAAKQGLKGLISDRQQWKGVWGADDQKPSRYGTNIIKGLK